MKKYTSSQKRDYHTNRAYNPREFGISSNSRKHNYSEGFFDACNGFPKRCLEKGYTGIKYKYSYNLGYKNGLKNRY